MWSSDFNGNPDSFCGLQITIQDCLPLGDSSCCMQLFLFTRWQQISRWMF